MDSTATMKKMDFVGEELGVRRGRSSLSTSKFAGKGRRKSNSLPPETVEYLKAWMMSPEHIAHPYPTEQEKAQIMADTGIELKQLTNWFVNNRKRYWKPRVEAKLQDIGTTSKSAAASVSTIKKQQESSPFALSLSLQSVVASNSSAFFSTGASVVSPSTSTTNLMSAAQASPSMPDCIEQSSCVSESGSDSDEELLMSAPGQETTEDSMLKQTEFVNIHILRPALGLKPTIDDVTVLKNVPEERVLRTFENCSLTYEVPSDALRSKGTIQNCRDVEIARLKSLYLERYLASPMSPSKRFRTPSQELPVSPRPKYRRVSIETWKEACKIVDDHYDYSLPSLEEAATLFGFARS